MKVVILLLNLTFLSFISFRIWRREETSLRRILWPALLVKLVAGVCLGLVYKYYYTVGDTFLYFQDGVRLASLAREDLLSYFSFLWTSDESAPIWSELIYKQPRAMFLSKVTSLLCIITADNYWMVGVYFSAITFASAWYLVKKIVTSYEYTRPAAIFSFLFFPSIVFWSAGIIKESLAMACLFFLSLIFLKIWRRESVRAIEWVFALVSLWIVWNLKYYYIAIFLPVAVTTLVVRYAFTKFAMKNLGTRVMLWCFVFVVPLLLISFLHPNFYIERLFQVVVSNYDQFHAISDPEDLIHYGSLEPTAISMLKNSPWALFSGLFRPFITEVHSTLQGLIAIENLILLILAVSALTALKEMVHSQHRLLLFSIFVYSILLCIFLALSTPNFGTLSRYRVGFLPYFVFLLTLENPLIRKLMGTKILGNLVR